MELWKANEEIHDKMKALVKDNHPDLFIVQEEILVMFRERAGSRGGQKIYGRPLRAPAIGNAMAGEDYKFILELGADTWENDLTSRQREALLDSLLTACRCEEDPKSGELKCHVAYPDIVGFRENIERYGYWMPLPEEVEEAGPPKENDAVATIEEMFAE